jgi:glycosyltransferase involved in cell wall biosynthesis
VGDIPRVSIVLTTYNRAGLLADTVDSIRDQTFRDWELIIADDASTDATASVAAEYSQSDARIRVLTQPVNLNMPGNLNAGIAVCRGDLIANLHDGDTFSPELLARWVAALDHCPKAAFVFNGFYEVDAEGQILETIGLDLPRCSPGSELLGHFYRRWRFNSPVWGTAMARRSAYEAAGPFDERFGPVADVQMWMRLAEGHGVAYVPEPLISLPSRAVLPSSFEATDSELARLAERIFWESRMRFFAHRPIRRALEVVRHSAHLVMRRSYDGALGLRRAVRRRLGLR